MSAYQSKVLNSVVYARSNLKFGDMMSLRNRGTEELIAAKLPNLQLKNYLWESRDQQDIQIERDPFLHVTNASAVTKKVGTHILDYEVGKE